jgi:hypothetical protein
MKCDNLRLGFSNDSETVKNREGSLAANFGFFDTRQ